MNNLHFIKETAVFRRVFFEPSMHKTAQDGIGSVITTIKEDIQNKIENGKSHPIQAVLSFLVPGMLYMFGFKWIAVVYELVAALGFDWDHFFSSLREKLSALFSSSDSNQASDAPTIPTNVSEADITAIVSQCAQEAFGGQVKPEAVAEVVDKYGSLEDMLFIKKLAQKSKDPLIMQKIEQLLSSSTGGKMRKGVLGFIIRLLSWLVSAALIAAGFAIGGSVVSALIGTHKKPGETATDPAKPAPEAKSLADEKGVKLLLNPEASADLSTETFNDAEHQWMLNQNINGIKEQLISWAQELYPQLKDPAAFDASPKFTDTLRMFQERNKNPAIDVVVVPPPFTSPKSIVDRFAADVAAHSKES